MLSSLSRSAIQSEIKKRGLPADFEHTVERWYLPLAAHINERRQAKKSTLTVGFNGAQGTGKSTITAFLTLLLKSQFDLYGVELSLDDFYLTHAQRERLAADVHPLLATRGVPGTHDVELAKTTLQCLQQCSAQHPCSLPRFDKAIDDRLDSSSWPRFSQAVDVILFEGWCNHTPAQQPQELQAVVNELEHDEDADAVWRTYANDQLALYHRELFDQADLVVFLKAPGFEKVYEWRGLQEKKLAEVSPGKQGIMNEQQLKRFIQHYERITRHGLKMLPQIADVVLTLNDQHGIESIYFKEAANG